VTLVVVAGQSNALGWSDIHLIAPELQGPQPQVQIWNAQTGAFEIMEAGVNTGDQEWPGQAGLEVAFAHAWAADHPGETLYIVKSALSSTGLANDPGEPDWSPSSGELFAVTNERVQAAQAASGQSVSAVLWMQGEQDSVDWVKASQYEANLTGLVAAMRSAWDDAPFTVIIGRITDAGEPFAQMVRDAQDAVGRADPLVIVVDTDGLTMREDNLHYDTAGLASLGRAFWATLESGSPPAGPSPQGQVITSNSYPDQLVGGGGDDTLNAGPAQDTLTGNGGADVFKFSVLPWSAGHVTDFTLGTDRLDLSALFQASGYTGADPVADGYISFLQQPGETWVMFDRDGPGADNPYPALITKLDGIAASGLTWARLSAPLEPGEPPPVTGGQTLSGHDAGPSTLTGGSGADTLMAGHQPDTLTGGGGADVFKFTVLPWSAGHVTDFSIGTDRLDLSALFQAGGYTGADPVADGYISFLQQPGETWVMLDRDGPGVDNPYPALITKLDGVTASGLTWAQLSAPGAAPPPAPVAGLTLAGNDAGPSTLVGADGDDTLSAGFHADTLTGGGGADSFRFDVLPWSAGRITDFAPGIDQIDLRPLFSAAGYVGSDPLADGTLRFSPDGQGATRVYFDVDGPAGAQWPYLIVTLDGVSPDQIGAGDWLFD